MSYSGFLVYVAGPYSGDTEGNVVRAIDAGDELLEMGIHSFVPHLYHHWDQRHPHSYESWMSMCLTMLDRCDCVLRLSGESLGAETETDRADEIGIPVFYSREDVLEFFIERMSEDEE